MELALSSSSMVVLLLLLTLSGVRSQASISYTSGNTSVLLGHNASFLCQLTGTQDVGHRLQFEKDGVILTDDYDTIDDTKWPVTDYYRLWVLDAEISDEEEYSCTLYPNTHFFHLGVSDPPSDGDMYWDEGRDWTEEGQEADLTCEASSSRPPATFRWFRGSSNVTSSADNTQGTLDSNGYATAVSTMTLTPTSADEGVIYTCHVDVPGGESYHVMELPVRFSGGVSIFGCFGLISMIALLQVL